MKASQPNYTAFLITAVVCFTYAFAGCDRSAPVSEQVTIPKNPASTREPSTPEALPTRAVNPHVTTPGVTVPGITAPGVLKDTSASPIVEAARNQIGKTIIYDGAYVGLAYPGGDVPIERGVCTDVIVRALRDGLDMDLQLLVHEDMQAAFSKYPKIWGLRRPDRNIDHRRVPNLQCYFQRSGYALTITKNKGDYLPGDVVTCTVPPNLAHLMIVSARKTTDGTPMVIHNIGRGTQEENRLFAFALTGHYRIKVEPPPNPSQHDR
jgi:uncharacterized protein YijF (DUF1287 family)